MDLNTAFSSLDLICGAGQTLSTEHRTALQNSLVILRKNYKFSRVLLWGKIFGIRNDYFIAQGIGDDELKDKIYLYSFNCMDWHLLPPASDTLIAEVAVAAKGNFTGDPSYKYENTEIQHESQDDDAAEEKVTVKVNEEQRLAVTVYNIDREVAVIPRGAYIKNPRGSVQTNRSFEGLNYSDASKLRSYLHFSEPRNLQKKSLLEIANLTPSIDFLDPLIEDIPKGSWSLQFEQGKKVCVLRSLLWLGLTFFHMPMNPQHGYIYIGYGTKNLDLPFML